MDRTVNKKIDIGCYYFPNYHPGDARNDIVHGKKWCEWNLVKAAAPRYPGHHQPRVPVWGYEDESDPAVMKKKIRTAAKYGIDYFIFDYYNYSDGPFLEKCLDQGFLPAVKGEDFKFALMWANHDWVDIHPCNRISHPLLYSGTVNEKDFIRITDEIIEHYFKHPNYYAPDNKPYFSIYELQSLLKGLGGFDKTRAALADFRKRTQKAGFTDLELNAVFMGNPILPGEAGLTSFEQGVADLGFNSVASYVWVHHFPVTEIEFPYKKAMELYFKSWDEIEKKTVLPYFPNVTVGWDASPRTIQSDNWSIGEYPYTGTIGGNTPELFEEALIKTKERLLKYGKRTFSINCWNEWTEGSMLEPEVQYGFGYLEAIKKVFLP